MTGICVPQLDERRGDGRQAADLVGRETELDLIGAFVATARTDGGTMLATCEPGFGKIVLLDAASQAASRAGPPILRAAGIQFEAGTSFSGPHQLGLPAPGRGVKPSVGPRSIGTKVSPWSMADTVARRRRRSTGSHRGRTAGRLDPLSPVVVWEDGRQTEAQLPRHRLRLCAGTGSLPIWPGHWRASTPWTGAVVNRSEEERFLMQNELDRSTSKTLPWRVEEAYAAELELERARWKTITAFVKLLTEAERQAPGYYVDPPWSVKDLVAHLGAWMAEARVQLLDIAARSYVPHEVDVDARNSATLAATKTEPWDRVWAQTTAARAWMLEAWQGLSGPDEAANWWIRKAGAEHYGEHLSRLRDWVTELVELRTRPEVDERDP
jgi:hypothetical protein